MFPPAYLCTGCLSRLTVSKTDRHLSDNAAMIAWASMHRFLAGNHDTYDIIPRSKWSIEVIAEQYNT